MSCTLCVLHKTATNVCCLRRVGKGSILLIDEAPSKAEDKSRNAANSFFTDQLLDMAEEVGLDRSEFDILHAVSCKPPEGKSPTKGQIAKCNVWVKQQMDKSDAKVVVLLGNASLQSITGKPGIRARQGRPFEQDGRIFLPILSPAMIKHDPEIELLINKSLHTLKLIVERGSIPREDLLRHTLVTNVAQFNKLLIALEGSASFDIETNSLYPWQRVDNKGKPDPARITMIGFGTATGEFSIPWNMPLSPFNQETLDWMIEKLDTHIREHGVKLVTHNGKFDMLWVKVLLGVDWSELIDFDTMMAHYILDENSPHGLKYLAQKHLGAPDWEIDKDEKRGNTTLEKLGLYHAHDLYYTRKLKQYLLRWLRRDPSVKRVFDYIIMPCVRLFVEIEYNGVYVHSSQFDSAETLLRSNYEAALKELNKWGDINWGSPQQLGKLLYETLKIPVLERTPTGNPSCSESVIKRIDHPCTGHLLKFREAKQQLSFFIEGWRPYLHWQRIGGKLHSFLHPSFKLHGTVTGRLSCEHPNLQQVPREPLIRSLIGAPPGWDLIEWDLSQIELRVAADLANETNMLDAFIRKIDVHWLTVVREVERGQGLQELVIDTAKTWKQMKKAPSYSEAIEILLEMGPDAAIEIHFEWKEYRKKAKAINFGYLYGMWWKKFKLYARDNYGVNVTDEQAEASREAFFELYPEYEVWHRYQRRFARKHGYVPSLSGRKRRLPKAMLKDDSPQRKEAERQAINSPVQSFANELNLMAAIQLRKEFGRDKVRICGTVHDAVLAIVKKEWVEIVYHRMLEIMRAPDLMKIFEIKLKVPIEAEGKIGPWSRGVGFDKWKKENAHYVSSKSK